MHEETRMYNVQSFLLQCYLNNRQREETAEEGQKYYMRKKTSVNESKEND